MSKIMYQARSANASINPKPSCTMSMVDNKELYKSEGKQIKKTYLQSKLKRTGKHKVKRREVLGIPVTLLKYWYVLLLFLSPSCSQSIPFCVWKPSNLTHLAQEGIAYISALKSTYKNHGVWYITTAFILLNRHWKVDQGLNKGVRSMWGKCYLELFLKEKNSSVT